ncbi:MAG: AAA family ATPase [Prevotella sp.]|nr:AAA family ATPase [Prevotella sp.]
MIKINSFELDDVKRVKAVYLEPSEKGLTVIGGKNNQGKTSVLDGIAWALGGDKFRPTGAVRSGSLVPPKLCVKLSNGIVVERSGKNSSLKVTDPNGGKSGQQLLNAFISSFALDLPKFLQSSAKEKADVLLQIIGVGDKLAELDRQESTLYNRRLEIGRIANQKAKFAAEMPKYTGVPDVPVSVSDLIGQQQEILARNGENERLRQKAFSLQAQRNTYAEKVNQLSEELEKYRKLLADTERDMTTAFKTAEQLRDESTAELEQNIKDVEAVNIKIRANLDKEKAEEEAKQFSEEYGSLTEKINGIRSARKSLLDSAELPLPGLSVENGELTYNGAKWDCMSGSEQLKVSAAIVRKLNPECGFVLMDKLEQMDIDTLNEFGKWLEAEGLQAIATRVSTGGECSVIIEDGCVKAPENAVPAWTAGKF